MHLPPERFESSGDVERARIGGLQRGQSLDDLSRRCERRRLVGRPAPIGYLRQGLNRRRIPKSPLHHVLEVFAGGEEVFRVKGSFY